MQSTQNHLFSHLNGPLQFIDLCKHNKSFLNRHEKDNKMFAPLITRRKTNKSVFEKKMSTVLGAKFFIFQFDVI